MSDKSLGRPPHSSVVLNIKLESHGFYLLAPGCLCRYSRQSQACTLSGKVDNGLSRHLTFRSGQEVKQSRDLGANGQVVCRCCVLTQCEAQTAGSATQPRP